MAAPAPPTLAMAPAIGWKEEAPPLILVSSYDRLGFPRARFLLLLLPLVGKETSAPPTVYFSPYENLCFFRALSLALWRRRFLSLRES